MKANQQHYDKRCNFWRALAIVSMAVLRSIFPCLVACSTKDSMMVVLHSDRTSPARNCCPMLALSIKLLCRSVTFKMILFTIFVMWSRSASGLLPIAILKSFLSVTLDGDADGESSPGSHDEPSWRHARHLRGNHIPTRRNTRTNLPGKSMVGCSVKACV